MEKKRNQGGDFEEIKRFLLRALNYWYLIVASLVIGIVTAWLINRYTTPVYSVEATIVNKSYELESASPLDMLHTSDYFRPYRDIKHETNVIKSFSVIGRVIKNLDWQVSYYKKGNIKTSEIYRQHAYRVVPDSTSKSLPYNVMFHVIPDGKTFTMDTEHDHYNSLLNGKKFSFGKPVEINGFRFIIFKNNGGQEEFWFRFNNFESLVNQYRGKLNIGFSDKSAVMQLSLSGHAPAKEIDFLNALGEVLNEVSIDEKNIQAVQAINFINEQLQYLADSLKTVGDVMQTLKLKNRDLTSGSENLFEKINELEEKKSTLMLTNQYLDYLEDYIRQSDSSDVIAPSTLGLEAELLGGLINEYIQLRMERKVSEIDMFSKSPIYKLENRERESMLDELEKNILENINSIRNANLLSIRNLNNRMTLLINSIQDLLEEELKLGNYQRIYELNEEFYNILLQSKAQASIAKASASSDYRMLNKARVTGLISPQKQRNYTLGAGLGLGIPLAIIYLLGLLNNKIMSRDDITRITEIPILGTVGHKIQKGEMVVIDDPKSQVSESFRNIRANLKYYSGTNGNGKVFLVTSSLSGEGKTFSAINLANVLALSGKKTVLVGGDLRRPTLAKYMNIREGRGISNYLAGISNYDEVIIPTQTKNLFLLQAGDIPPNPAELLLSEHMVGLVDKLRNDYDFIVVDSPPLGVVSDTTELIKFADVNILIVRQGVTTKPSLGVVNEMVVDQKLPRLGIIFNDVNFKKLGYGYGNDYYYRAYGYYS